MRPRVAPERRRTPKHAPCGTKHALLDSNEKHTHETVPEHRLTRSLINLCSFRLGTPKSRNLCVIHLTLARSTKLGIAGAGEIKNETACRLAFHDNSRQPHFIDGCSSNRPPESPHEHLHRQTSNHETRSTDRDTSTTRSHASPHRKNIKTPCATLCVANKPTVPRPRKALQLSSLFSTQRETAALIQLRAVSEVGRRRCPGRVGGGTGAEEEPASSSWFSSAEAAVPSSYKAASSAARFRSRRAAHKSFSFSASARSACQDCGWVFGRSRYWL